MPDYKLKVEIDASQLEKTLRDAFRKLQLNYGGGGGTPVNPLGAGSAAEKKLQDYQKRTLKTVEIIHKADTEGIKLKYALNKQMAEMRDRMVKENTLLRQYGGPFSALLGAIGGRPGGAVGRLMDLKLKTSQGGEGSKIPQFVKIAGFAAGLAGAAGLGKLIIDSSPVLQAMLKILNIGIMFILRPIGDFVGFLLRPLILALLKFAIPFYKAFGGANAQKAVNQLFSGDIPGLVETIDEATDKAGNPLIDAITKLSGLEDLIALFEIIERLGKQKYTLENLFPNFPGAGASNEGTATPVDVVSLPDGYGATKGTHPWLGTGGGGPVDWMEAYGKKGNLSVNLAESLKLGDSSEFKKSVNFAEETKGFTQGIRDVFAAMEEEDSKKMQESMQRVGISFLEIKNNAKLSGSAMESVVNLFQATLAKVKSALAAFASAKDNADEVRAKQGIYQLNNPQAGEKPQVEKEEHGWLFLNPDGSIGERHVGSHVVTKRMLDAWKSKGPGYRVRGFASGGFINEPIFGFGANTGQGYMLGERGPEQVTPVGGSTGGGITANFYVYGNPNGSELERTLKPQILKWIRDEASRRGIL